MKTKFKIGDWVETKAIVNFDYDYPEYGKRFYKLKRKMFRQSTKKKGVVSGMSYGNIGERKDGFYDEPAEFKITKRILVYLIKEGMINKPFGCLEKDLKKIPAEEFPFCKRFHMPWTEEDRKQMAEYVKDQPRDSKGRWTK